MAAPESIGGVVFPGDLLNSLFKTDENDSKKIVLGPGLRRDVNDIMATKTGIIKFREPNVYWIDGHQKRYLPTRNDDVIGIVIAKAGDYFRVDIGASESASLSYLAFEGATKRNRPNVQIGDLVYAKLLSADRHVEPELVCMDSSGKSIGLGVLCDGFLLTVSLHLIRKLRTDEFGWLKKRVARYGPFEMTIGMNGRVWVKTERINFTIAICNIISLIENANSRELEIICDKILNSVWCM